MSRFDLFDVVMRAFIVAFFALLAFLAYESVRSGDEFRAACEKDGGVTVYDGRQYQCTAWVGKNK